jgi:hypothetical protein
MIWLNVDFPDRLCTVHKSSCAYVLHEETPLKGIRQMKDDGGWYDFTKVDEAESWSALNYPQYQFKKCGKCKP